jgi:pimeloyl-ACP methyl ester carboxylesterase
VALPLNHHRAGAGEPLVLIHGIGSRWQVWNPVLARLQERRDVVALDLPGFAGSPSPPPGTPPGVASLTGLVADFLRDLGLEAPHVAGNSLGGWISLELAKLGRARSATALSPAGFHNRVEVRYQRAALWLAVRAARLIASRAEAILRPPLGRALVTGLFVARPGRWPLDDAAASVRTLAGAPWFNETLAAIMGESFSGGERIDVPVTIAWGERDRLLLPRQAPRAAAAVPRARLLTLTGCGHVPTYDDPELVARVLLDGSSD